MNMEINRPKYINSNKCIGCSMSGVWRAVGYNPKVVVIFHSPKACAHIAKDLNLGSFYYDVVNNEQTGSNGILLSSQLLDKHTVFGGEEQLERCIEYAANKYDCDYIVIANSCIAGIIGDDVRMVAQLAQERYHKPILTVPCYGFLDGSQYFEGFFEAGKLLIDNFMQQEQICLNKVTVIGEINQSILNELKGYLDNFGLKVEHCFPHKMLLAEIKKVPESALLIVIGGKSGRVEHFYKLANLIGDKFNIPVFQEPLPLGWNKLKRWLQLLGEFLGKEAIVTQLLKSEEEKLQAKISTFQQQLQGKAVTVVLGRSLEYLDITWLFESLSYSKMKAEKIVLLDTLTVLEQIEIKQCLMDKYTVIMADEVSNGDLTGVNFIITTHEIKDSEEKQYIIPFYPGHGVKGVIDFCQQLYYLEHRSVIGGRNICGRF